MAHILPFTGRLSFFDFLTPVTLNYGGHGRCRATSDVPGGLESAGALSPVPHGTTVLALKYIVMGRLLPGSSGNGGISNCRPAH